VVAVHTLGQVSVARPSSQLGEDNLAVIEIAAGENAPMSHGAPKVFIPKIRTHRTFKIAVAAPNLPRPDGQGNEPNGRL
jgi:hypothetical protein